MNNSLGINPMGYTGVRATNPPNVKIYATTPNANDNEEVFVGDLAIAEDSFRVYMLTDVTSGSANWRLMTSGLQTIASGSATLVSGTVTVTEANIAADDIVLLSREGVNASTALGVLDVTITAGTDFDITALTPGTPGSTLTGDLSTVKYVVLRAV